MVLLIVHRPYPLLHSILHSEAYQEYIVLLSRSTQLLGANFVRHLNTPPVAVASASLKSSWSNTDYIKQTDEYISIASLFSPMFLYFCPAS